MSIEMQMLVFTIGLGLVQLFAAAGMATLQRGIKWNFSSREGSPPPLEGMAARLDRAFKNLQETFPFFAAAILLVQLGGRHSWLTVWGAQLYFYGRVVYLPIYAAGIPVVRTLIWCVSTTGLVFLIASLIY